jgi:SAM-dependent methyltransferase
MHVPTYVLPGLILITGCHSPATGGPGWRRSASLRAPCWTERDPQAPAIMEHQRFFLRRVCRILEVVHGRRAPHVRMLDSGCDESGRQLWHLARLTRGPMVGISPDGSFPRADALARCRGSCQLRRMDGTALRYPDRSFDVVLSSNVLEHVTDPERYVREAYRVLRPGGLALLEFYPVWSGPRGHHIHPDMMERWGAPGFVNDGSTIPDWAHLRLSRQEMQALLSRKLSPRVVRDVIGFIYGVESGFDSLSRVPWSRLRRLLETTFDSVRITPMAGYRGDPRLRPTDGKEDYDVEGAWIIGGKGRNVAKLPVWLF